jgi:hypothetical protein
MNCINMGTAPLIRPSIDATNTFRCAVKALNSYTQQSRHKRPIFVLIACAALNAPHFEIHGILCTDLQLRADNLLNNV